MSEFSPGFFYEKNRNGWPINIKTSKEELGNMRVPSIESSAFTNNVIGDVLNY